MICSSLNLLRFISSVLCWAGLYFKPEEISQGRSAVDEMDDMALARVRSNAERVTKMTDEAGQTAVYRSGSGNLNSWDRWIFRAMAA